MSELSLSASVGAPPAPNKPDDVRTVQGLLQKITPPLAMKVAVTGKADLATLQAIREFQKRFFDHPDGRVDPDGRTLMHLNDGFASQYVGCSADNRRKLDYDLILAQKWLDVVIVQISIQNNKDVATKINNIF